MLREPRVRDQGEYMVTGVDRIVIAVPQLECAVAEYQLLLGCEPLPAVANPTAPTGCCFDLNNTLVELIPRGDAARIAGLVFALAAADAPPAVLANGRGLDLRLAGDSATAARRAGGAPAGMCVDHLVLRTADAGACIDLFAGELGIRLALDRDVPQWGGRMLFFRTGKLTLEVIEPVADKPSRDAFWGIAYRCYDLELTRRQLTGRGVAVSAIRQGRKPGTRVMTVKSHCLDIPTLLLEAVPT